MEKFVQLTLSLVVILLLVRLSALLSRWLGMSAVAIQIMVGILLGTSLFNFLGAPIVLGTWGSSTPTPLHGILKILGEVGLIQLMFLGGLHTDWPKFKRDLSLISSIGLWVFVSTAVAISIIAHFFVDRWAGALAISAIMGASSFGISVYNLNEMKLLGSRAAYVTSGAAILSGLFGLLLMVASLSVNYVTAYGLFRMVIAVSWFLGKLIMFFAISYFLTSRFLRRIAKTGFKRSPRQTLIGYFLLVAALYAWGAMHFGSFAAIVVASLGGGLLGASALEVKESLTKGLRSSTASILVGIFFIILGMGVNFKEAGGNGLHLILLFVTMACTKLAGCWISTRKVFDRQQERLLTMIGTLPQGEMGIVIAAYLFSRGLISPSNFNIAMIVVVTLTMLSPVAMKIVEKVSLRGVPQWGTTKQSSEIPSLPTRQAGHRLQ